LILAVFSSGQAILQDLSVLLQWKDPSEIWGRKCSSLTHRAPFWEMKRIVQQ